MDINTIWSQVVLPALLVGLSGMLTWIMKNAVALLKTKLAESMHFRGSAVVVDTIISTAGEMGELGKAILADGKVTEAEKQQFKEAVKRLAKEKLLRLSGFYKKELDLWVDEQVSIGLGKLLSKVL